MEAAVEETYRPQILIPLDGSKLARTAVEAITPLAKATNATMTLVSVMEPVMDRHFEPFAHAEDVSIAEAIETYLKGEARHLSDDTGLVVTSMLLEGFGEIPGEVLAQFAADNGFTMIAMSTRGLSGFKRLIMGSIAKQLLDVTEVPVLLFPAT